MKIKLKKQELELEVNEVDTHAGVGWNIVMQDERQFQIKFLCGKWDNADNISNEIVEAIGDAVNQYLQDEQLRDGSNLQKVIEPKQRRARITKYLRV